MPILSPPAPAAFLTSAVAAPWYRHRWPWLLMLGPAWVLIGGSMIGYLAVTRPDAMVVDDYYRQGKAINQDLRREQAAAARGIAIALRYDPVHRRLLGTLRSQGLPLGGIVHLRLVHPTQPEKDIVMAVLANQQGVFEVGMAPFAQTRWQVQAEGAARDWRLAGPWRHPGSTTPLVLDAAARR